MRRVEKGGGSQRAKVRRAALKHPAPPMASSSFSLASANWVEAILVPLFVSPKVANFFLVQLGDG